MCFEFEALYWAKHAEEEEQKQRVQQQGVDKAPPKEELEDQPQPA